MCYAQPGPRCTPHAYTAVTNASVKYRSAVSKVQDALDNVSDLRSSGAPSEQVQRAKDELYAAQVKASEAKHLLRLRRKNLDMTPKGREVLAGQAHEAYKRGDMKTWRDTNDKIDALKAEYDARLREFHAKYGDNPNKRGKGRPSPDKPYPEGEFKDGVGWESHISRETELQEEVIKALAEAEVAKSYNQEADLNTGMKAFMLCLQTGEIPKYLKDDDLLLEMRAQQAAERERIDAGDAGEFNESEWRDALATAAVSRQR